MAAIETSSTAEMVQSRMHVRILWGISIMLAVLCFAQVENWEWLVKYPQHWTLDMASTINAIMTWLVPILSGPMHGVSSLFGAILDGVRLSLAWLPWPVMVCLVVITAYRAQGGGLALFALCSLSYILVSGYWLQAMNTLALVGVAVPLSVVSGLIIGVVAHRSRRLNVIVQPMLDLMQTVPAFAYLIPILLIFGFGPVVGLIASMIFAIPPMVRNTILGLQRVPPEVFEAGLISGCNRRQLLFWVEIPAAQKQLMIGVNQTTMAALSMVIIASIIGGSDDVGWAVLTSMRKAQFGPSLLAGIVIALMAMMIDRISLGFSQRSFEDHNTGRGWIARHPHLLAVGMTLGLILPISLVIEQFRLFPSQWVWNIAGSISASLNEFVNDYYDALEGIKRGFLFYFLLPLRIGLDNVISPYSWGFEFTSPARIGYAVVIIFGSLIAIWQKRSGLALSIVVAGVLVYFGTSGIPWPVFIAAITLLAFRLEGIKIALLALGSMLFILLNNLWQPAMTSAALCGAAILIAFPLGTLLGICAAEVNWVSRMLRPINDTLQTMPQFVYLIPVLMLFQVGEFSALIAVVAYAIVPSIRYTEHGLRSVPPSTVEAAIVSGCTRRQILWWVKLPQAIPEIMLGLNQTVIYGLSMLVIAALVGTRGLGQQVYIALGKADSGLGLVAGISIALIAITTDRILQCLSKSRKAALGV
jgi:glycine betaine/proline transport system permease protein